MLELSVKLRVVCQNYQLDKPLVILVTIWYVAKVINHSFNQTPDELEVNCKIGGYWGVGSQLESW